MPIEWCTPTSGTKWWRYEAQRMLVNALYHACKGFEFALRALGSLVLLFLPSGIKVGLLIDDFVPDFTLEEKDFHAIRITIGGQWTLQHPLPKGNIREIWQGLIGENDWFIPDSENWTYHKDPNDGIYKPGVMFDPVKQYGILGDGVIDLGSVLLVLAIGFAIWATGIPKMAFTFVKHAISAGYQAVLIRKNLSTTRNFEEITDSVEDLEEFFVDNEDILKAIQSRLGVRLVIGK